MNKRIDDTRLRAWRNFITVYGRLIEAIDAELAESDTFPLSWYDILIELYEAEEHRLRLHRLAERVVLSRSSITRLVDQLEEAGMLRREPDPEDRRGSYAVLMEGGLAGLRAAWPVYAAAIDKYFGRFLDDEEALIVARAFERMLAAVETMEEESG
jgi:DNA-binding MarR family transcriptional regulator